MSYFLAVSMNLNDRRYLLIPTDLEFFKGYQSFLSVYEWGEPASNILTSVNQLQSLRSFAAEDDHICNQERVLVSTLLAEAKRRGYELPEIELTTSQPKWSLFLKSRIAADLGREGGIKGGLSTSEAKRKAARNNGLKGGRPKKSA